MAFIPVHLNTLRPGDAIPFDLHLKLITEDDHYVHYMKKSDTLEADRFLKLQQKGVKKVFIKIEDEELYLNYLDEGLNELENENLSAADKASLAKDTLHTQAENAERALENEKNYSRLEGQLNKIVSFFTNDKSALKGLLSASGISADNSQHSANVASLALGIATLSGISNTKDLLNLGIACLVHDIGNTKMGIPATATREKLQGDELRRYLSHPAESVGLLAGKKFITPQILSLIADHEEIGEGRGYPEKKRIEKLSTLSQIFNLSNTFDKFCSSRNLDVKSAIDPFFEKHSEDFILEHLTILTTVITSK